jgi:hypothetical protein
VWLALELIVPIAVGLATFYGLLRIRKPPAEARAEWRRFAMRWTPTAITIIVAAQLIWH